MTDGSQVTWQTVVVALAAGAIGSLVAGALALLARATRVGREIRANDRALALIDDHLERWVADETVELVRHLHAIRGRLSATGAFYSGEYGYQIGLAKERALHAYRDQENTVLAQAAEVRAREGGLHSLLRAWRSASDPVLRAPERVRPVLDRWAAPPTQHLSPTDVPPAIDDPRERTIEGTLTALDAKPNALD